jgi:hypothetical protein
MDLRQYRFAPITLALAVLSGCPGRPADPDSGRSDVGPDLVTDAATDSGEDLMDVTMDVGSDAMVIQDTGPPPPPPSEPGRHNVEIVETRRVIPGPGLPNETMAMTSNNNLDVVRHSDGRIYLAWRTAPDHFASDAVRMHVISSTDEMQWQFEATFGVNADLREPRFLSFHDGNESRLFLYMAELGTNPLMFEPRGMWASEKQSATGNWTSLEAVYRPGFIPWRTRVERGRPYMVAYLGGEHIYRFDGIPLEVELLTTQDGRTFEGVDPDNPVVYRGGASETDFVITDDGTLLAIMRNEAGDSSGFGSNVCQAPASNITQWICRNDPKKYDSPLMFWYDGEAYLIGRRNVTVTGNYDLMRRHLPLESQAAAYQIDYWMHPKRCALWRFVRNETELRVAYIADLPSIGDTCFPAVITGSSPGEFIVYNYSSDIEGPELSWRAGQAGPTYIYRSVLRFTPRETRDQ